MKFMTRGPLLQFIGALLVLIVVIALNVLWYNMVSAENAQVSDLAGQVKAKTDDSARAAQAKKELVALSTDQSSIQQYFVSTSNVVPFLGQLQATGSFLSSKVQIASVSATPGTPYGQLSLSLSIVGSFNSVMRTLGSIEYGPYDTAINTLSFDAPPNAIGSSSPQWVANGVFTIGTEANTATTTTP